LKEARQAYLSLKGTPDFESEDLRRRLAQTEFLLSRILRRAVPLARMLSRRLRDPAFVPALAGELLRLPGSLPGIRISGLRSYLAYLSQHYLQQPEYRHPLRPCDFCGSPSRQATFFYRNQKNVRCKNCGLEFVERKPEEGLDVLSGFYEEDHGIELMEKAWHDEQMLAARISRLRDLFKKANREFPAAGGKVLEIATGQGHLLRALADRGMVVQGIEPSGRLTRYCNEVQQVPVRQATVAQMNFEANSFDYMLAYHVLEHLDRPSLLFEKAARFLTEGGYLFIEVPVPDLYEAPREQKPDELAGYGALGHMHYFTMKTLPRYFEKYGFEVAATFQYLEESFPNGGVLGRKK
jgi:ubiquinone/menaquinone biosynthesis C-methylase UbiE